MNKRLNKFGKELGRFLELYNISINDFAERIGTTSKNLIDIIEGRVALSFNMICNISFISDISADYIFTVEENFRIDNNIDKYLEENNITLKQYLRKFHYKELHDKYGVNIRDEKHDYSILEDIFKYLRITDPKLIYKEDNHIFYKSKNDKKELLALWLERCFRVVQNQNLEEYKKENLEKVIDFIREEAKNNRFDKERLIEVFNKNGIFLAIESDLDGSKIRGAFRVLNNKPAVYITTKYKRCADIYFALLHELAHCKSDFNRAKSGSIVSYDNHIEKEDYEIRADVTAFNWMVDSNIYNLIKDSLDFEHFDVVPAFVVYRLAYDKLIPYQSSIYQDNNLIIV